MSQVFYPFPTMIPIPLQNFSTLFVLISYLLSADIWNFEESFVKGFI